MSIDPDETQTQAAYYYAGDNPITHSDPTGDFDVAAAVAYAKRYASAPGNSAYPLNPKQLQSIPIIGGLFGSSSPDECTNFASQILHAGGLPETGFGNRTSLSSWWYWHKQPFPEQNSLTWSVANDLYEYLVQNGIARIVGSVDAKTLTPHLSPGEFIFYQWHGHGAEGHVNFVTSGGADPYVAQQTSYYDASWLRHFKVDAIRGFGVQWRGTVVEINGGA
jgi:hypothetical protein